MASTKEILNNSKIETKLLPKMREMAGEITEKAPLVSKVSNFIVDKAFWIVGIAGLARIVNNSGEQHSNINRNFNVVKAHQSQIAKNLVNTLSLENKILAQENPEMACDLRRSLADKNPLTKAERRQNTAIIQEARLEELRLKIAKKAEQIKEAKLAENKESAE